MLSFFPNPYPDEILYSVLARYHIRSGNTSPKVTLRELFSTTTCTATVDLPSNLNSLVKNMPLGSQYSVENFIKDNTLYTLYAPFLPDVRATKVFKAMKSNYGGNIHTTTGIMASTIHTPKYLRFCPKCFDEDLKKFGEAYWHRIHQVSAYMVCSRHKILIKDSTVPVKAFNKHEFYSANKDNCIVNEDKLKNDDIEMHLRISRDIEWILSSRIKSKNLEWFYDKYKALLITKGLATATGRVDQQQLLCDFVNFYGEEFLKTLQCNVIDTNSNWISSIVRKPRKVFHPTMHILAINFLLGSAKEFFLEEISYKPFGNGPWPCLNRAAHHYHEDVIETVKITYDSKSKKAVGTFLCSCGFIYSRSDFDEDKGNKYKYGRVKEFGALWKEKLFQLLDSKAFSLREISRQLNVDVKTVKRYGEKFNLLTKGSNETTNSTGESNKSLVDEEHIIRGSYRLKWIELNKRYTGLSKTELREKDEGTYIWLYRNDKNWLSDNSPKISKAKYINNRVHWEERDNEILEKVKELTYKELNSDDKPERITISRISKKLGLEALIERHIDKLPKTKAYLKTVVENVENYQIRKVLWAGRYLNMQNEELKKWRIIRVAGLKVISSEKVEETIKNQLKIY